MSDKGSSKFIWFLGGLGLGIGLGILFAPMSGEETRNNLSQRASDLSDRARYLVDQGRERVRRQADRFAEELEQGEAMEGPQGPGRGEP